MQVTLGTDYVDSPNQRAALIKKLFEKTGQHLQLESIVFGGADGKPVATVVPTAQLNFLPGLEHPHVETKLNADAIARHAAYAHSVGKALTGVDELAGEIAYAQLPPSTLAIRHRVAQLLNLPAHTIVVEPLWGVEGHIDSITIRAKSGLNVDATKRRELWRKITLSVVDPTPGWRIKENATTGVAKLIYGERKEIPRLAPYDWDAIDAAPSTKFALGVDKHERQVWLSLDSPHTLVCGTSGSGKSVCIENYIYNALAHGFELAIVEPVKEGVDFQWAEGYTRPVDGWGDSLDSAVRVMEAVYAEGMRRRAILKAMRIPKVSKLPQEVLDREGIRPILLVLDEFTSMVQLEKVPKLKPGTPAVEEPTSRNFQRETIGALLAACLAQLRYVSIFCVVGNQNWNASEVGSGAGSMRVNMANRILWGRSSSSARGMALSDSSLADDAYSFAHGLGIYAADDFDDDEDDGEARGIQGRGIAELEGQGYVALQGAFATHEQIAAALESRGITPRELDLPTAAPTPAPATATPAPTLAKRPATQSPKTGAFS